MKNFFAISVTCAIVLSLISFVGPSAGALQSTSSPTAAPQSNVARKIGVVKTITGTNLTLAPESGPEVTATVQPNARILRLAPGEKDLKNAAAIQFQDLQVGDTVRVRGFASDDGKSINTLEVIVITRASVDAVRDQIQQDWQKRGIGGLINAVDPGTGTITISVTGFSGKKSVSIHTSKSTIFRCYAPDSTKFEDAKQSSLDQIRVGDQLRARGERSADAAEFTADEVVTGTFRNIAGTVNSVDASSGTLTVQDVLSKKPVQVKVASDSQLHQLPAEMAQRIATRVKAAMSGSMPAGMPGAGSATSSQNAQGPGASSSSTPPAGGEARGPAGGAGGGRAGGAPDFQQILSRMPAVGLNDLHKGDAVMIVSTEGSTSGPSTVITLLSGVEPILQAAPNASQAMMLTPWSLGGAPGGDAGNQ